MIKKIFFVSVLLFAGFTGFHSVHSYKCLNGRQSCRYEQLVQTFQKQVTEIRQVFAKFDALSARLNEIANIQNLKSEVNETVHKIIVFGPKGDFLAGWEYSPTGPPKEIEGESVPPYFHQYKYQWIDIEVDANNSRYKGTYRTALEDGSFLVITYNLTEIFRIREIMTIGYESFSKKPHEVSTVGFLPTSLSYLIDRIKNNPILLSEEIQLSWHFNFSGSWNELDPFTVDDVKNVLIFALLWCILIASSVSLFIKRDTSQLRALWMVSFVIDIFCLFVLTILFLDFPAHFSVTRKEGLTFQKASEIRARFADGIIVPTTIYVESLAFPSDVSFLASGFIAQMYPKGVDIKTGFIFPKASALYEVSIKEIARVEMVDFTKIIWQFGVSITHDFSGVLFPFDTRELRIKLWPLEVEKQVVFLPDFASYESLYPPDTPGVNDSAAITGWRIEKSEFLYDPHYPYKRLAAVDNITYEFSILLARNFINSFLSHFLSVVLCTIVTFLILFIPQDTILN